MTTAREICELALQEAGVVGLGQTAAPEDINKAFKLLHNMLAIWQKRRWMVPNLIDISAPGNSLKSNYIGPGQYYNTARPDKIQAAYFKQIVNSGGFDGLGFDDGFDNVNNVSNEVSYPLIPIWSYEDYAEKIQLKNLNSWPKYYFYDNAFPYGNVFIWPIPSSSYEVHLILKGPIDFVTELSEGQTLDTGAAYTDGIYLSVPFINISGLGAEGTANLTVADGFITSVVIQNAGYGYKIGDVLSVENTLLGGTGIGFLWRVNKTTDSLDAEMTLPPEYLEAIHYNLCIRIVSMYQYPANPVQGKLAIVALNTIRNSNTQISRLRMPSSLRFGNGNGFYIFNADQN